MWKDKEKAQDHVKKESLLLKRAKATAIRNLVALEEDDAIGEFVKFVLAKRREDFLLGLTEKFYNLYKSQKKG